MAGDSQSQRRRAAVCVLEPLLAPEALLEELWILQDTMRGDAVSDIIGYIDGAARRHLIDAATSKRLYADFYKALRLGDSELPLDPWPAMLTLRGSRASAPAVAAPAVASALGVSEAAAMVVPTAAVPAPVPQPDAARDPAAVINPVAAAMARIQPSSTARAAADGPDREPQAVFGALLRSVVAEVHRYHREAVDEVRKDALRLVDSSGASASMCSAYREAWQRALQHDWLLRGSVSDLAALLRVTYQALAEAFGRVGAEQILQRGLRAAEAVPEARLYSPRRLMASM
jgi:hypothetical protein